MATFVWPPISVTASSGPIQFNKNGVPTTVSQDTTTPANSVPLPVTPLNTSGVAVDPATSGKQDTGNTSLASIDTKQTAANASLASMDTKTPALGQALAAASTPVVLTALQVTALTPPTTITANQGTGGASAWKVDGSGVTQPISASALPLPTGAATETTLSAMSAKLPATLGQKPMSTALAVSIASDQSALPAYSPDVTASGTITIQNSVPAGTATAGSALAVSLNGMATVAVQITGTYTGALSFQGTLDGANWVTISSTSIQNMATGALSATITSASVGLFAIDCAGFAQVRITALAAVTGTATISLRACSRAALIGLDGPLPAGTNSLGNIATVSTVTAVTTITNPVTANQATAAAKTVKSAAITVGVTAVRATTDGAAVTAGRTVLKIKPSPNNTGAVYLGTSTVVASATANANGGMLVLPAETMELSFDAGDYYLISDTAGQVVHLLEQE